MTSSKLKLLFSKPNPVLLSTKTRSSSSIKKSNFPPNFVTNPAPINRNTKNKEREREREQKTEREMRTLPSQGTEVGKWLGFITAIWVQCISGNNYTFSNYSDALKSLMGLTQLQLNNLSVAKDIGKAFGILAGLASDRVSTPILLLIGSLEGLVGYGAQWLVIKQAIRPLPYWQMCVFLCLGGNSTTWMNTAVLVTCIRNFRRNRGPVSGILKGYVGLSTAIFTDLCSALFTEDPASFVLMLALIPLAICAIAMIFLREIPPDPNHTTDDSDSRFFTWLNAAAVLIAIYLLLFDLTGDHGVIVSRIFSVGLIVLLAAPAALPALIWFKNRSIESVSEISERLIDERDLRVEEKSWGEGEMGRRRPEIGEEHSVWDAMRKMEFWVLFVSFLCGVGTGMAVMNNMGQMGLAMGYSDVSIFVSLTSIWGFFGRIASGSVSEYFLKKSGTPRPLWNAASQILMAVGYIVMAVSLPGSLYIGSIVVGVCYGIRLAISVPTASELFGLKYYGLIYNILILNLPIGSFLFSGLLAGLLYDAEAIETPGGGNTCIGRKIQANAEDSGDVDEFENPPKVEEKLRAVPSGVSTDSDVTKREAESITRGNLRSGSEKFEFQAEVSRLMDIIINSLYSNKDIFLRELISNASDALDKIRFLSLTDKDVLGEGDNTKLEILIKLDKEKKILSIRDRGIGMTKEDLIKNLGTIAKSGTSAFVEKMQASGDLNLIGQFGVGFYSVYLVADYVEVISKHNDDKQYVWESKADGSFGISEDTWNEPLGRGTEIRLHLRDEAKEYLDDSKLKELVKKYSEFINFPIYLWATKEVDVEVPSDEDDSGDEEESSEASSSEGETEEEEAESKPKKKTVKETTYEWELLNDMKAIWLRNPKEVTEEEYTKFYQSISKDFSEEKPLAWTHFIAEGDVEFKALLFVPPKAPTDLYESYYNTKKANLKLYVRRVFISDEFDDLLPKFLNFLKGLVDSDTLPLNVSREMLQQHSSLKTIKKKLIRKALDMIRRIADEDPDEYANRNKTESSSEDEEKKGQYARFWNEFGKSIKLGIIEDAQNRNRLAKLLRFESTKSDGKLVSLDEYISRMKTGQKDIFYITGSSKEQLEKSPFLERLTKKNYEVIFFTDPVDEYLMQYLMDYEDKHFQNVSKEGLELGKEQKNKDLKESFKALTKWWKAALVSENVDSVKISNRLDNTPCVVVTSKYGWSANMEKIMQAQTLSDSSKQAYMRGKRVLEVNPRHPIIKELRERVAADPEDESLKQTARLIYQTALMESGFNLPDPKEFAGSIYGSIKKSLDISADAAVEEEEEETEETAETAAEAEEEDKNTETEESRGQETQEAEDLPLNDEL